MRTSSEEGKAGRQREPREQQQQQGQGSVGDSTLKKGTAIQRQEELHGRTNGDADVQNGKGRGPRGWPLRRGQGAIKRKTAAILRRGL